MRRFHAEVHGLHLFAVELEEVEAEDVVVGVDVDGVSLWEIKRKLLVRGALRYSWGFAFLSLVPSRLCGFSFVLVRRH